MEKRQLLRFPAGLVANAAPPCPMHEELYALDGALSVNAVFFAADFYGFLPAGFPRQRATAPNRSVAFAIYKPTTSNALSDHDTSRRQPPTAGSFAIGPAATASHGHYPTVPHDGGGGVGAAPGPWEVVGGAKPPPGRGVFVHSILIPSEDFEWYVSSGDLVFPPGWADENETVTVVVM